MYKDVAVFMQAIDHPHPFFPLSFFNLPTPLSSFPPLLLPLTLALESKKSRMHIPYTAKARPFPVLDLRSSSACLFLDHFSPFPPLLLPLLPPLFFFLLMFD